LDIVDAMLTVKELMLSPFGIVFEPLDVDVDDGLDDPQAAAARLTTAARLTQPARRTRRNVTPPWEREGRPPLLLLLIANPYTPFARRHPDDHSRQHTGSILFTNYALVTMLDHLDIRLDETF
jgi:hypothetical protein